MSADPAEELCAPARSLFLRGPTQGTSGNLSPRLPDGGRLTGPTNAGLGRLSPDRLSRLDCGGHHVAGDRPTKEWPLHAAFQATRWARAGAVVHLHSPYAVALSCLADLDPGDCIPALTPSPVMRLGKVPLIPQGTGSNASRLRDRRGRRGRMVEVKRTFLSAGTSAARSRTFWRSTGIGPVPVWIVRPGPVP